MRKIDAWLARLSDPDGLNAASSPKPFLVAEAGMLPRLIAEAGMHNVRPALVQNLRRQINAAPEQLLAGGSSTREERAEALLRLADELRLQDVVRSVFLSSVAHDVLANTSKSGIPVVLVKGADFAETVYRGLQNRAFSDIDLLVRPQAEQALSALLASLGFISLPPRSSRVAHTERQWIRSETNGAGILVEVHTDLVHAPELRRSQTLTYDLYAAPASGGVTPAARMILAALHGATSHLFGRLQYVVDGLMIARMEVDARELRERARECGAELPLATMLRLSAKLYDCEASRTLLRGLRDVPFSKLERRLITAPMVLAAKSPQRWRLLPQRYLYRRLMRTTPQPR